MPKVTLSVIKADVGSYVGHSCVHPDLMETAKQYLAGKGRQLIIDYLVTHVGDDLVLILTHDKGTDNEEIHWPGIHSCKLPIPPGNSNCTAQDRICCQIRFQATSRGWDPG